MRHWIWKTHLIKLLEDFLIGSDILDDNIELVNVQLATSVDVEQTYHLLEKIIIIITWLVSFFLAYQYKFEIFG